MNPDDIIQVRLKHKDTGEEVEKSIRRADLEARLTAGKAKGWSVVTQTDTSVPAKSPAEQAKRDTAAKEALLLEQRNAIKKEVGSAPRSFVSGVFDGLSSNLLDEAVGLTSKETKERMRRNVDVQKSESPNAYAAGQMAGSVGQQLGLTRLIPGMRTPGGQLAYSGIEGAISGLGEAEDISSPEEAAAIAITSGAGGMIGQVGGTALGRAGSGALKKLVGNTGLESAKEIEKRVAAESLGKELAEINRFAAQGPQVLREVLSKSDGNLLAAGNTTAGLDAMKFAKQRADNAKIAKEIVEAFEKNYPEQISKSGAIGSSLGSEATSLQSYQNMLTDKLSSGNDAINAVNKAMEGAIDGRFPNFVEVDPIHNRSVVQKALDRLIEMNAAKKASTSKADLTAIFERLGRE